MTTRIEEAKKLSLRELGRVGYFELRLTAAELGILSEADAERGFLMQSHSQQVELLYSQLHKERLPTWRTCDWVKTLFENIPQLYKLVGRNPRAGTSYEYIICLEPTPGVFEHRYMHRGDFYPAGIRSIINKRLERLSEDRETDWIEDMPPPAEVAAFVIRKDYLIKESAIPEVADEAYLAVIREHGHWMRVAFRHFPNIVSFVKASGTRASPATFAVTLAGEFSWMKQPTFDKIHRRLSTLGVASRYTGKLLWETGAPKGSLVFDRATFDKYLKLEVGFEEEVAEEEKEEVAEPAPPPATCACGVELRMSKMFWVAGVGARCGECEAKVDPEYKERTALVASCKVYLEPPAKVRVTKFDGRPGIDDRGAWSSPSWEEDFS